MAGTVWIVQVWNEMEAIEEIDSVYSNYNDAFYRKLELQEERLMVSVGEWTVE